MLPSCGIIFWILAASQYLQVHSEIYTMMYNPNVFDDQYIGCSDKLEKDIMPKLLHKEMANKQFKDAWINATERWEDIKDDLEIPEGFEDEHGIAVLTFTNNYPPGNPIYQQLNGNLTIAGASRKDYMEKFHFKALHFYLTRALQILKPNCDEVYTTYRGSPHSFHVRPVFKFGRFTSSSLDIEEAKTFGTESLFHITTCFGARIGLLSFFPDEKEVLIPPAEKFLYDRKENSYYILRSTGQMCSYFNCAYLEAEKRKDPVCRSDMTQSIEEMQDGSQPEMSATEFEERMRVLEDHISRNNLYWDHYRSELETISKQFSANENETTLYNSLKKLAAGISSLRDVTFSLVNNLKTTMKNEGKILKLVHLHQELIEMLLKSVRKQQEDIKGLELWFVTFCVIGATILIYKYWMRRP